MKVIVEAFHKEKAIFDISKIMKHCLHAAYMSGGRNAGRQWQCQIVSGLFWSAAASYLSIKSVLVTDGGI